MSSLIASNTVLPNCILPSRYPVMAARFTALVFRMQTRCEFGGRPSLAVTPRSWSRSTIKRNSSLNSFKDLSDVNFNQRIQAYSESLFLPSNLVAIKNEPLSNVVFHCLGFPYVLDEPSFLGTVTDNDLR